MCPTTSPNMGLIVPIPSTGVTGTGDTGPGYAQNISNDLTNQIDSHDHSSGKGVQITPAGLNINADLTVNSNNLTSIRANRYTSQASSLSGGTEINEVYVIAGNLWFNNSSGTPIQITQGGGLANSNLAGDATGMAGSNIVTSLTGASGIVNVIAGNLQWTNVAGRDAVLSILPTVVSGIKADRLILQGQSASGAGTHGGDVIAQGGAGNTPGGFIITTPFSPTGFPVFGVGGSAGGGNGGGVVYGNSQFQIPLSVSGTYALTNQQYIYPYLQLSGSITGDCTVTFPPTTNIGSHWMVDGQNLTLNGHNVFLKIGSVQMVTTIGVTGVYSIIYNGLNLCSNLHIP